MSELLSAVAATLGAPEELIRRSADARAAAQGVETEQVLQAWAGGSAPVAPSRPAPPPTPAEEPSSAVEAAPAEEQPEPSVPVVTAATAVLEPQAPVEPGVEPAPLSKRVGLPAALGAALGVGFGLVTAAFSAVFLVDNASSVERADGFGAAVELQVLPVVIGMAALWAVFGGFLAVVGRRAPAFFRADLAVLGGAGVWIGAVIGAVLGASGGGLLVGVLGIETINEGIVAVSVSSALWWLVIGGAILGAGTAVLAHVTAVPAGLTAGDRADSSEVRTRLSNSLMVPLVSLLTLVAVIAVIATLFVMFHEAASMLAIVISAGILLFAFLGGYRPSIKLRYTEVIAALAGIATVVIAIVMVFLVRGH